MAFCSKCGTKVEEGVSFCPSCGTKIEAPSQKNPQQTKNTQNEFVSKLSSLNDTKDDTASFEKEDIEQNKGMAILSYISWLVLIPFFAAPKSKFARYHVNQGFILAILETAFWIVEIILSSILFAISWRLGFLVSILGLVKIVFLVYLIIGIVNVVNGKAKELPIIGKFRIIK